MRLISWNVNGLRACVGKGFLDFFDEIRADAVCLQETKMQPDQLTLELDAKKPVIVCGDMNVAHKEIDLKNPGPNRGSAGFTDEEREKFPKLLDAGFTDTFRHLHPDLTGAYSWWSYRFKARQNNAGWRIDYFLVSDRIKDKIVTASILPEVMGSDHCPVMLEMEL